MSDISYFKKPLMRLIMCKDTLMHANVLSSCTFQASDEVKTIATNGSDSIYYNPETLAQFTEAELAFALIHEAEHIIGLHNERESDTKRKEQAEFNEEDFHVAADLSINNRIIHWASNNNNLNNMVSVPSGALIDHDAIPKYQASQLHKYSVEEIYQLIKAAKQSGKKRGKPEPKAKPKGGKSREFGDGTDLQPNLPSANSPNQTKEQRQQQARIKVKAAQQMTEKMAGTMPAHLKADFEYINKPAQFNWKRALRRFVQTPARGNWTYQRINRNYLTSKPMVIFPGRYSKEISGIHVSLDVSGSVLFSDDLPIVINEVISIAKVSTNMTISGFDTDIQFSEKVPTNIDAFGTMLNEKIRGGGGTDLTAPFKHVKSARCMIVVTDGYGPCTAKKPAYPVMFVLIGRNVTDRFLPKWGRVINLSGVSNNA